MSRGGRARRGGGARPGTLHVVGTPIGNLEDITLRAIRVLAEVDLVAAEDTRRARILLGHHGIRTPLVSYFEGNEARRGEELIRRLRAGESVALISEAGMPGVADPGARLVRRCVAEGIAVDAAPGPTALVTALVLSALPSDAFRWVGFLPRKGRARAAALARMTAAPETTIIYESPRRAAATLAELAEALGPRPAALARELTKVHQEIWRGSLPELAARAAEAPPRGEVVLLVAGDSEKPMDDSVLEDEIARRLAGGARPREVADALAAAAGGRRRVYQMALALAGRNPATPGVDKS